MPWSTISELLVVMGGVGETARSLESTMARLGDIIQVYRQRQTRRPAPGAPGPAPHTHRPGAGASGAPAPAAPWGLHPPLPPQRGNQAQGGADRGGAEGASGGANSRAGAGRKSERVLERVRRGHAGAVRSLLRPLNLRDFDLLLSGVERDIDLQDWRRHTEYSGYTSSDRQVKWFWEALGRMPKHELRRFLYFCTSIHRLPPSGFGGLHSRFQLHRGPRTDDLLPTAHTCFLQLSLPGYSSADVLEARLHTVTSPHILQGFGLL